MKVSVNFKFPSLFYDYLFVMAVHVKVDITGVNKDYPNNGPTSLLLLWHLETLRSLRKKGYNVLLTMYDF